LADAVANGPRKGLSPPNIAIYRDLTSCPSHADTRAHTEGRLFMNAEHTPSARSAKTLPAQPSLEHLKNEAKQRLKALRAQEPRAQLTEAQLAVARDYGFASWRALKAHVDAITRKRVFAAARAGDIETVRRAFEGGFDPGLTDDDGRTIHQIGKTGGNQAIELLARDFQERRDRPAAVGQAVKAILDAAEKGRAEELGRLLDEHLDLIDARGGNFWGRTALHMAAWRNRGACVRLLLDRGADVRIRDYGDNAYALHFAADAADLDVVTLLVEAGSDVVGEGDDHQVGVIGWATCFARVREDVAAYLLAHGANLNLWSAIALDREDDVRGFIARDPSLVGARMSRNEHRRMPLHHAAAKNRPRMVRLLLELGADPNASDAVGMTALATASQEHADPAIVTLLLASGAKLDFLSALYLERYELAEAMLRDDPSRIGPGGRDEIALHLSVSKKNAAAVRWLIAHGADVNAKGYLWDCSHTALHMTAESGAVDMARLLLDAGADPNIRDDKYDATVLGWAEYCEQPQVAELVRERGGTA
jgi:ankyrin repeat protein